MIALTFYSCCIKPSDEDWDKIGKLKETFGEKFSFEFDCDFYLRVQQKIQNDNLDSDAIAVYKLFWFDDFDKLKRRPTAFVYLNLYDPGGKFLYQLAYDPQKQTIAKEEAEHY
jgi:hypothetical protein